MRSKVSLVKSKDHYNGVHHSLEPLRDVLEKSLSSISSLVIKINLVITRTPRYNKGVELATTPIESVKSFIDFISQFYKGKIIIAEEAAWGDTNEGFQMYGFSKLAKENSQVELFNLKEDQTIVKKIKYPEGNLELPFSVTMLDAPFIVSITRPKTHCSSVITAAIKNVVVGAVQKYSMRRKIHRGKFIHTIMASIAEFAYPNFVIIDGTVGMQGGVPVRGEEIKSNWTIVSYDALAADSLATYLMGFDINLIGYLNLIKEKGLGLLYPDDEIKILGEKPKNLVIPYKSHRNFMKMSKRFLKIDRALYEVDGRTKTYKYNSRNFDWKNLSEEENIANKKHIDGYKRIFRNKKSKRFKIKK